MDAFSVNSSDHVVLNHLPQYFGYCLDRHILQISNPVITVYGGF
jgi:hypothetical protein